MESNNDYSNFVSRMGSFDGELDDSLYNSSSSTSLTHHGVLGMKWGVRRSEKQLNGLSKKDNRWVNRNSDKITKKATKKTAKELGKYSKELMTDPNAVNKSGKLNSSTITAYNNRTATLMSDSLKGLTSPSGKIVTFVAKRGEIGVFMALADQGYNMNQIKNGIFSSGKIAYKNKVIDKVDAR